MDYLRWAKLHRHVSYELTASGVPGVGLADIDTAAALAGLEVNGAYGDPELIDAIAERYRCPAERVVPVPGASSANFIALAAAVAENVVACNSLTKVYGLGGLRVGWLVTSTRLAERARRIMDPLSVDNAAPSASLAFHALSNAKRLEARYRRFYDQGQAIYRRWLADEPLVSGYESHGALFEFVRLPDGVTGDRLNDILVAQ